MRAVLVMAAAGCAALLMSGCVKGRLHLSVHPDGSADVEHLVAFEQSFVAMAGGENRGDPLRELRTGLERAGYRVESYAGDTMTGVTARRHFASVESALAALDDPAPAGGAREGPGSDVLNTYRQFGRSFTVKRAFFTTTYVLDATLVPATSDGSRDDAATAAAGQAVAQSMIDFSVALTFPVRPTSTNAPRVSNGGRTLEWPLAMGAPATLSAVAVAPNLDNIAFTAVLGILLLFAALYLLKRLTKSGNASPASATGGGRGRFSFHK